MRPIRILVAITTAVLLAAVFWLAPRANDFVKSTGTATRYVAKMTCSCVYVVGRSLEACKTDLPEVTSDLSITLDETNQQVSASVLWFKAVARYEEARGCKLAG